MDDDDAFDHDFIEALPTEAHREESDEENAFEHDFLQENLLAHKKESDDTEEGLLLFLQPTEATLTVSVLYLCCGYLSM